MKNLVMVVHASVQQELADTLRGLAQVRGFTFSHVEGHSAQSGRDPFLSARDRVVGYVPRIRVDILLEDADLDPVLAMLCGGETGVAGQGVYWVTAVERHGRL
ncbi:MAG: DUF3240 family protein [Nitrospirae bacterium]|nr:DUF3240 family protein [Nitrospirota bacterium]